MLRTCPPGSPKTWRTPSACNTSTMARPAVRLSSTEQRLNQRDALNARQNQPAERTTTIRTLPVMPAASPMVFVAWVDADSFTLRVHAGIGPLARSMVAGHPHACRTPLALGLRCTMTLRSGAFRTARALADCTLPEACIFALASGSPLVVLTTAVPVALSIVAPASAETTGPMYCADQTSVLPPALEAVSRRRKSAPRSAFESV